MRNKLLFVLVAVGVSAGAFSAYVYAVPAKPLPPAFTPATNPYPTGIFANGIVESPQSHGENINIYPEVSGVVTSVLVTDGQHVTKGTPLVTLDDSVQRATTEQIKAQADASLALLQELRAEPRRETLEVAKAQVELATASLKNAQDQLEKQTRSFQLAPESVSKDVLDNARNAEKVATANLAVVTRQYDLTKAGAWTYDVKNQERQHEALVKAESAAEALLAKYTIVAPSDGLVLSVQSAVGSYVSPQGGYDTYTQGLAPVLVMGESTEFLDVRCYVDEILIPRLASPEMLRAEMSVRGSTVKVPLEFVRIQPYVSPKIQLSNERTEKVDVRVLPVIFRFRPPKETSVYLGQLVDVYLGTK